MAVRDILAKLKKRGEEEVAQIRKTITAPFPKQAYVKPNTATGRLAQGVSALGKLRKTAQTAYTAPSRVILPTQYAPERFVSNVVSKGIPQVENFMVGAQRAGLGYASKRLNQASAIGDKIPNINLRKGTLERVQTPKADLAKLTGTPVTGYRPTAQKIGGGVTDLGISLAEIGGVGKALKSVPYISKAQQIMGKQAGKVIAGSTLKSNTGRYLVGKGLANVSQGLPYSLAWQGLNKPSLKEGATDIGIDLALGAIPIVGAISSKTNIDNQLIKKGLNNIPDPKYQKVVENLGWKGGDATKRPFDLALFNKDADTVKRMLPDVPEAYKKKFAKEIDAVLGGSKNQDPLTQEARKYKSADEFVKAKEAPKTVTVWNKSKFSSAGAYTERPVIRKVENKTLYQGGDDTRQFWTPDKKYAEQFGNVKEKTGTFYQVDNGNRMTEVYVDASKVKSQLTDIYNQAKGNVGASKLPKDFDMPTNKDLANFVKETPQEVLDDLPRMIKLKPQQAQNVELNLKALPEPRGLVKGEGFTMYSKDYQDVLKQGGKTIKIKQPLKSTKKVFRLIERQEKPAQTSLQAEILKHQDPDIAYRIWRLKEDRIKANHIFDDGYVKGLMSKLDDSKQTPQQMSATLADIEKRVYGSATPSGVDFQKGTKSGAGLVSNLARRGEAGVSGVVGKGLQSESPIVRNVSRLLQGFGGGLGKTRQATEGTGAFKGGVDYAQKISYDTQQYIAGLVGKDAEALERIHAVLDPDLAKVKVSFDSLTPKEKEATEFLRQVSDYINDTNYKNGFISEELWQSHRGGKYLARAYEPFDYAPEIADFLKQSRMKMDLAPFKQRTDVNDWKVDNAIRDPAYLVAKRLQQTMFNDEVLRTFDWLKGTDMVSQTPKAGFVQLSDHKSYGELAGKFVRKDVLDDVKGMYFVNDFANKVYDVLRAYDRNPIRQTQKQILTIFNPAVRLGNNFGNFFFAHLNGINPVTFAKNRAWASAESKGNGQLYRRMVKDGLLGTDTMKADIANFAQKVQSGYKDDGVVKKVLGSLQKRYGNADDVAKLGAMKTWLDRGYSYEEAARRVYNGFQNYRTVGWLYDVGSKLPVFGNPFVRFQGDLQRIIKNSIVDHPIRAVGTLMMWQLFTDVMSTASGETPEDRATRESRVGAPRVPFTKTSLEVQTPWGAVNAGRLLGYVAYTPVGGATTTSDLARVLPVQLPDIGEAQKKNNPRIALKNLGSAPDIGPVLSVLADADFRGKSISDPNQNRYQGSLLSDDEKRANQLNFLARQYIPYLDDVQDTVSSIKGEKDYYGRTKTPTQALLRTGLGLKVEKFGAKEAEETRMRNQSYDEKANEAINKSISAVKKQLLKGEIDESTANKRIQFFKKQQTQQGTAGANVAFAAEGGGNYTVDGNKLTYLKDNGDLDNIDLNFEVSVPKQTGSTELDKKRRSAYYGDITAKINDVVKLNDLGLLTDAEAETLIKDLQNQKEGAQKASGDKKARKIKVKSGAKKLKVFKPTKKGANKRTTSKIQIVPKMTELPQRKRAKLTNKKEKIKVKDIAKVFENLV